jgi:hypothetical protein
MEENEKFAIEQIIGYNNTLIRIFTTLLVICITIISLIFSQDEISFFSGFLLATTFIGSLLLFYQIFKKINKIRYQLDIINNTLSNE